MSEDLDKAMELSEAEVHGGKSRTEIIREQQRNPAPEVTAVMVSREPPTTRTREEIARDLAERIANSGAFRYDLANQNAYREADLRMVASIVASALTTAADEAWERAIAAFNNEIARQAEFGMYPSEEDFRLALETAQKANP